MLLPFLYEEKTFPVVISMWSGLKLQLHKMLCIDDNATAL